MIFPIYLDNNSTTRLAPEVLEFMMFYLEEKYGNPSSGTHKYGREAAVAVDFAREQIANLIKASPEEIFFTSGTTESINLAFKGIVECAMNRKTHIITSTIEHSAVINVCKYLENFGINVTYIKPDSDGIINPDDIKKSIRKETILISIMTANNEIGTVEPIGEIAEICGRNNILFHTDGAQSVGKIPVDVNELNIDLMSFSAHKIYGPKGVGALFVKSKSPKIKINSQIHGGGQEKNLRSGTLNVPAIAGFGKACELCSKNMFFEYNKHTIWRNRIIQNNLIQVENSFLNGHRTRRLPNNVNIGFSGVNHSLFLSEFKDLAVSFSSACSSETFEPSYVLSSIGRTKDEILCSVRIGLGRYNSDEEIEYLIKRIPSGINKIKSQIL